MLNVHENVNELAGRFPMFEVCMYILYINARSSSSRGLYVFNNRASADMNKKHRQEVDFIISHKVGKIHTVPSKIFSVLFIRDRNCDCCKQKLYIVLADTEPYWNNVFTK